MTETDPGNATLMTGGEAIVRMLEAYGVEFAFGMGGFQALPYYDALARRQSVRHVLIRDEKHGAFAADGYARVANRPAVADATLGPGATNLVSGLVESLNASVPMIALTGEINGAFRTRGGTQESDQVGMLAPAVKESIVIDRPERVPELMRRAFVSATGGRPGPVHIDVPEDVFHATLELNPDEFAVVPGSDVVGGRRVRPDSHLIENAAELVRSARSPVMIAGGGIHLSRAYEEVAAFAESAGVPVATTISGKGSIDERHELALGLCGRYSRFANELIAKADLVIVVGSKLGEIGTDRWSLISPATQLIHIDIDPDEIGKFYIPTVGVWADARLALIDLVTCLDGEKLESDRRTRSSEVNAARSAWLEAVEVKRRSSDVPIHMARLLAELANAAPPDTILVADGGFAAHWSALLYDVAAGRSYIANRGHAAIGYGLAGAIGAKLAAPSVPVVALCGDNGFAMSIAELETAKRAGAHVVSVVVNNQALGYVKALQSSMYNDRFISVDFQDVPYSEIGIAFGAGGRQVDSPDALQSALFEAFEAASDGPYVLDVRTTTDPREMLPGVDARTQVSR
jgi:acetolactate synthase I/II/III large subunit